MKILLVRLSLADTINWGRFKNQHGMLAWKRSLSVFSATPK